MTGPALGRWVEDAACWNADPRMFFPPEDVLGDAREALLGRAKALCRRCPVQPDCLNAAVAYERTKAGAGVWGGLTETERRPLVAGARRAARTAKRAAATTASGEDKD